MNVTLTGWPLSVLVIILGAFALLLLAYGVVWLLVLKDKYLDPERYARFRELRASRKGNR